MDLAFKQLFLDQWKQYFGDADLPLAYYYADEKNGAALALPHEMPRCFIGGLAGIREGRAPHSLAFQGNSIPCTGGKRYTGFSRTLRKNFEYFLSYGIPGELEGERYKKTPALVSELVHEIPPFKAPGVYLVVKRWDHLDEVDHPLAVIFFATPDVLSGLFTLADFDEAGSSVIAPFGAGCASIIQHALIELSSSRPRAILGMLDPSARPQVPADRLTFTVPWPKFVRMVENMPESFLITETWEKVRTRFAVS